MGRFTADFDRKWFSQVSPSCRKLFVPGDNFFPKGIKFLFFKGLYGSGGTSPVCLAGPWQDNDAMAMDDGHALFNPKLEFYNIIVFVIMNFIEIFFDEEEKWLIKNLMHVD